MPPNELVLVTFYAVCTNISKPASRGVTRQAANMALAVGSRRALVLEVDQSANLARGVLELLGQEPVPVMVDDHLAHLRLVFGRLGWRMFYGLKTRFFLKENQTTTVEDQSSVFVVEQQRLLEGLNKSSKHPVPLTTPMDDNNDAQC